MYHIGQTIMGEEIIFFSPEGQEFPVTVHNGHRNT